MWRLSETLPGYVSTTRAVSDKGLLPTITWDRTVHVFDITNGLEVSTLAGHTGFIKTAKCVGESRYVFTESSTFRIEVNGEWKFLPVRVSADESVRYFQESPPRPSFADDRQFLQGDGSARLWNVANGSCVFQQHREELFHAICSDDRRFVAFSSPPPWCESGCCRAKTEIWGRVPTALWTRFRISNLMEHNR